MEEEVAAGHLYSSRSMCSAVYQRTAEYKMMLGPESKSVALLATAVLGVRESCSAEHGLCSCNTTCLPLELSQEWGKGNSGVDMLLCLG